MSAAPENSLLLPQEVSSVEAPTTDVHVAPTQAVASASVTHSSVLNHSSPSAESGVMPSESRSSVINIAQSPPAQGLRSHAAASRAMDIQNVVGTTSHQLGISNCNTSGEVICIDSDTPPRPSSSHTESNGRKVRRLNDSTPVIIVDDDEATPPSENHLLAQPAIEPAPRVGERRRLSRATSSSSIRPVTSRISRSNLTSSRGNNSRAPLLAGAITDESPPSRDAPQPTEGRSYARFRSIPPMASHLGSHYFTGPLIGHITGSPRRRQGASQGVTRGSASSSAGTSIQRVDVFFQYGGSRRARNSVTSLRSLPEHAREITGRFGQEILQQIARSVHDEARLLELQYLSDGALPDYETLVSLDEQLLRQKNAAPKTVIEKLPETIAAAADKEVRCVICMCDVEEGEKLRELPCSHKYHKTCIDEWLTYNGCCPVDKQRICPVRSIANTSSPMSSRFRAAHASAAGFNSMRGGSSQSSAGRSRAINRNAQS